MIISTTIYIIYIFTTINEDIWKSGKKRWNPYKNGKKKKTVNRILSSGPIRRNIY